MPMTTAGEVSSPNPGQGDQIAAPGISLTATPDDQLEALRKKQAGYTQQLETNTTKAANVGRLNTADALESQKANAKMEAMRSGRPWTTADEAQFGARANRLQQQNENQMLLGREATIGQSIGAELNPINSQIGQQQNQKAQQLEAIKTQQQQQQFEAGLRSQQQQSASQLQAQQEYQQAMLKLQQQQQALDQARQLQTQMYGPQGPSGNQAFGAGGVQQPYSPATNYNAVATGRPRHPSNDMEVGGGLRTSAGGGGAWNQF